ncbi:MAG: flavodoxin, partial [Ruminococcus flavefaciens]
MFFKLILENANGYRVDMTATANQYMTSRVEGLNPPTGTISTSSYAGMEHNDENRHTELVSVDVPDWESYDNVFIGYPIWWREASWVVDDFVKENDFTGKNVIPFCTSMSSPLGDSGTLLAEMAGTGNWLEGMRFTSSSAKETVQSWATGLDLPKQEQKNDILIAYFTPAENSGVDAISSATLTTWNGEDMGAAQV